MEDIKIMDGIQTALRCYLSMTAQEVSEYYKKNKETTIASAIEDIARFGYTNALPAVLVVVGDNPSDLGAKMSNLYEIGYRQSGSIVVDRTAEEWRVRFIATMCRKESEE